MNIEKDDNLSFFIEYLEKMEQETSTQEVNQN